MAALPPAQPEYILRGHQSQIHALAFYAGNKRLLSADADGFVISWDMVTKRPVAGWRAHSKTVLSVAAWDDETMLTHGRDNRLAVWQLDRNSEKQMQHYVPGHQLENMAAKPTMLQEMTVNTMNFCAFAWCEAPPDMQFADPLLAHNIDKRKSRRPILLAIPNTIDSDSIDVFYMPAAKRKSTISSPKDVNTGMAMALLMSAQSHSTIAAGYESGDVMIHQHDVKSDAWNTIYRARPHSQPILSLCLHPDLSVCFSSSADSIIAKHPFANPDLLKSAADKPLKLVQTKHAGQQGMAVRNDGRIFTSAGWDSRVRVYSAKTMKELAVLKYHKQGCYQTALSVVETPQSTSIASAKPEQAVEQELETNQQSSTEIKAPEGSTAMTNYERKVMSTHWLAAGSKDGNISLWDIF